VGNSKGGNRGKGTQSAAARLAPCRGLLRLIIVLLVAGVVIVKAGGTFARLIEIHLAAKVAASSSVGERTAFSMPASPSRRGRSAGIEAQARPPFVSSSCRVIGAPAASP